MIYPVYQSTMLAMGSAFLPENELIIINNFTLKLM